MDPYLQKIKSPFWEIKWREYIVLLSNLTSIYNSHERKSEYASKHGLFIVTLGWFVDSVTKNGKIHILLMLLNLCNLPVMGQNSVGQLRCCQKVNFFTETNIFHFSCV